MSSHLTKKQGLYRIFVMDRFISLKMVELTSKIMLCRMILRKTMARAYINIKMILCWDIHSEGVKFHVEFIFDLQNIETDAYEHKMLCQFMCTTILQRVCMEAIFDIFQIPDGEAWAIRFRDIRWGIWEFHGLCFLCPANHMFLRMIPPNTRFGGQFQILVIKNEKKTKFRIYAMFF